MKQVLKIALMILLGSPLMAQDIQFTFADAQITNDGVDDYYDVDVMIQSTVDFKLGSGQLYITYNTVAFGENISANTNITYSQPSGSILGEQYSGFPAYKDFIQNDNTTSRVSLAFQQGLSAGAITANNVVGTPKVLLHIRIKFADVSEDPMIAFETGSVYLDQFFTACGPSAAGGFPDCSGEPGAQLLNDTFDSSNAADTTAPIITLTGDDPQEIAQGDAYNELGATTDDGSAIVIDDSAIDINTIGSYSVTYDATDIVGNTATQLTRTVNVVPPLGVEEVVSDPIVMTPNPAKNLFEITGISNRKTTILIYDLNGKMLKQIKEYKGGSINISDLSLGVYYVKLNDSNSKAYKLIKY